MQNITQEVKTSNHKNLYLRNIKVNYLFSFIKGVNLTSGIWMLYLVYKGMSLFEIGLLEGIYHVTSFLMETPTGAIADLFGRKTSRLVGLVFVIFSSILMITSQSFWGCALAFVFTALSNNFESGAAEALVYDSLKLVEQESLFMKLTGRLEVIFQLSSVIGLMVGGVIGTTSYATIYLIVIGLTVVMFIVGLFFKEPQIHETPKKETGFKKAMISQYKDSYLILKGTPRLLYIIFFGAMISTFLTLSFFYLQVAWKESGFVEWQIGLFLALSSVFGAVGGLVAEKVDRHFGDVFILKYFPFVVTIAIPTFYFVKISILSFAILCVLESIIFVATRDYINKLIPSEKRATIISFDSAVFSLCMICLFPIFGFISDHIGIRSTFLLLGGVFLILTIVNTRFLRGVKEKEKEKDKEKETVTVTE